MHINIRSLVKNLDQLFIYVKLYQFDVLTVNETRLDSSIKDHKTGIVGYEIVRKYRNRNQGEVAIYLETINIEVCKPEAKPFLINTWYRPPSSSLELFNGYEQCMKNGFRKQRNTTYR